MKNKRSFIVVGCVVAVILWQASTFFGSFGLYSLINDYLTEEFSSQISNNEAITVNDTSTTYQANKGPSANFTFAACMLVKDDNRRLPEWLAYHYTVLPLRRLIIAGDPRSITSPQRILDEFQNELGINITLWKDDDYMRGYNNFKKNRQWVLYKPLDPDGNPYSPLQIYQAHLWRQQVFLTRCVQELWREGHSWITLLDSDEFLSFNWYRPDIEGAPQFCIDKSRVGRRINSTALEECQLEYNRSIESGAIPRGNLPSLRDSTIGEFIEKTQGTLDEPWFLRFCIVVPRLLFGGTVLPQSPQLQRLYETHPGLKNDTLQTLRYRQHGKVQTSNPGKSIVDVSRFDPSRHFINNPHRVFRSACQSGPIAKYSHALFRANHYTGGLDDFNRLSVNQSYREIQYRQRNSFEIGGESEEIISWFDAFVEQVGYDRAIYFTQTLRKEVVEEYYKIAQLQATNDSTTELPKPMMPSADYLKEYEMNWTVALLELQVEELKKNATLRNA